MTIEYNGNGSPTDLLKISSHDFIFKLEMISLALTAIHVSSGINIGPLNINVDRTLISSIRVAKRSRLKRIFLFFVIFFGSYFGCYLNIFLILMSNAL